MKHLSYGRIITPSERSERLVSNYESRLRDINPLLCNEVSVIDLKGRILTNTHNRLSCRLNQLKN
jgi:hypothetical protein